MSLPTGKQPFQKAWVVRDIELAAKKWSESLNIGPFYLAEYKPHMFEQLSYRGAPGELHMKTAIAYCGDSQIELVEPMGVAPSAYSDVFSGDAAGFHHLCFWSDDLQADIRHYELHGHTVVHTGKMKGGPHFAYIDAMDSMYCHIELLERSEAIEKLFNRWHEASKSWDGKNAIIKL